jgi:hypothetical protein
VRHGDLFAHPAPQLRLPPQVVGDPLVVAASPRLHQSRSGRPGRRVQAGQPPGDGVPAGAQLVALRQVVSQPGAPLLVGRAGVEDVEQRPDHAVGLPGLDGRHVLRAGGDHCGAEQVVGRRERDPRADAVPAPPGPEPVRQALGQPPLDAAGGHGDDVDGERVGERPREQVAERVDQRSAADGVVDVEHARDVRRGI